MQPEDIAEEIVHVVTQHPRAYTPVVDVYPFEDVHKPDSWEAKWNGGGKGRWPRNLTWSCAAGPWWTAPAPTCSGVSSRPPGGAREGGAPDQDGDR